MPHVIAGRGHLFRLARIPAIGLALAGLALAAWSAAILAFLLVPAAMLGFIATPAVRRLLSRQTSAPPGPLIIDGEYEIVDAGSGAPDRDMQPNQWDRGRKS